MIMFKITCLALITVEVIIGRHFAKEIGCFISVERELINIQLAMQHEHPRLSSGNLFITVIYIEACNWCSTVHSFLFITTC